eukprot:Amastigsp_a677010_243.p4 type:complete len:115 gc:universal Amastigsp_a677010_243:405-749(+)
MSILRRSMCGVRIRSRNASSRVTKSGDAAACLLVPRQSLWYVCRASIECPSTVQSNVCTVQPVRLMMSVSNLKSPPEPSETTEHGARKDSSEQTHLEPSPGPPISSTFPPGHST